MYIDLNVKQKSLVEAIEKGNVDKVSQLLQDETYTLDVIFRDKTKKQQVVTFSSYDSRSQLRNEEKNVYHDEYKNYSLLIFAIEKAKIDIINLILEDKRGQLLINLSIDGNPPLFHCISGNNFFIDKFRTLIKYGANICILNAHDDSLLIHAIKQSSPSAVREIIHYGLANIDDAIYSTYKNQMPSLLALGYSLHWLNLSTGNKDMKIINDENQCHEMVNVNKKRFKKYALEATGEEAKELVGYMRRHITEGYTYSEVLFSYFLALFLSKKIPSVSENLDLLLAIAEYLIANEQFSLAACYLNYSTTNMDAEKLLFNAYQQLMEFDDVNLKNLKELIFKAPEKFKSIVADIHLKTLELIADFKWSPDEIVKLTYNFLQKGEYTRVCWDNTWQKVAEHFQQHNDNPFALACLSYVNKKDLKTLQSYKHLYELVNQKEMLDANYQSIQGISINFFVKNSVKKNKKTIIPDPAYVENDKVQKMLEEHMTTILRRAISSKLKYGFYTKVSYEGEEAIEEADKLTKQLRQLTI